MVTGDPAD